MQILRIYEDDNTTSLICPIDQAVSFKAIKIRISGTSGATAPTIDKIGRISYWKRGKHLVDMSGAFISHINNIFGGNPRDSWSASSAGELWVSIPRRFGDSNIDQVVPSDKALLKCTFSDLSGIASGPKIEVYLDLEDGVQQYDLAMHQFSDSVSGASVRPFSLDVDNILAVLISATVSSVTTLASSNISEVLTSIGGKSSDASIGALKSYTNEEFNIESDWELAAVLYASAGDVTSRLYDGCSVKITTSGASTPEIGVVSAMFDSDRLDRSIAAQSARYNALLTKKASSNRVESVQAIQRITGK